MADDPWADDPHDPDRYGGDAPNPEDGPNADLGTYASDREVEAPNPKKSMGTGVKVLVALLIGGGLLALLCCGGVFAEYWSSGILSPDDTPAGVRAKTDEILTIALPDDFNPVIGIGGEIPLLRWTADARMGLVSYSTPGGGQFTVTRIVLPPNAEAQRAQMEAQLTQGFQQNGGGTRVDVADSRTVTLVTADGRSVDWTFGEGTGRGPDGGDLGAFRKVEGRFVDGTASYALTLTIAEDEYDEAEIISMLESIELVDPQTEPVPPGKEPVTEEDVMEAAEEAPAGAAADGDAAGDAEVDVNAEAEADPADAGDEPAE